MVERYFLDTSYAIALANPKDQLHGIALDLAASIVENDNHLVATSAILLEIGNSLSKLRYRAAAVRLLDSLRNDDTVEVVPNSESLFDLAFSLFQNRMDKEWSLTDCLSFVVMEQFKMTQALTPDIHFEQAGFVAMMKQT